MDSGGGIDAGGRRDTGPGRDTGRAPDAPGCTAGSETCNGMDDDCDGATDEPPEFGSLCDLPHAMASCTSGACGIDGCDDGWDDCDGDPSNGCEQSLDDPMHCGACGAVCDPSHSSGSWTGGECRIGDCDDGWDDCDGDPSNGCEHSLDDPMHCGACGTTCSLPHATSSCSGGACGIDSCDSGWADCDSMASTGCETGLDATSNSCSSPESVGTDCGDVTCGFVCGSTSWDSFATRRGTGGRWFRASVEECSSCCASVTHRITLDVPSGVDYDLFVYRPCGTLVGSSVRGTGSTDQVEVDNGDACLGEDSGFDYYVEVRHFGGSSCAEWEVTFEGRSC